MHRCCRAPQLTLTIAIAFSAMPAGAQQSCTPLPAATEPIIHAYPSDVDSLASWIYSASPGTTILLHDGTYDLRDNLQFGSSGLTLRSASGNRDAVIVDTAYSQSAGEPIAIFASDVTIADITISRAYYHPIHIWDPGTTISGILIQNVRIVDPGEQAIKVNPASGGFIDNSTIQCCSIELTDSGRTHVRNSCYTGGVDVHQGLGWIVRRNRFEGFWCASGLSEHAVHFWKTSRDTIVEENLIIDCARGIGFGLGSSDTGRTYPDDPYPEVTGYMGHIDGVIRNNFIAASRAELFSSEYGFDTGISLEQAHGAEVMHNTVASTQAPASSSVEWRFTNTSVVASNNLSTSRIWNREDEATETLQGNLQYVPTSYFVDIPSGDLHLTTAAAAAVDAGVNLGTACTTDFDGDLRDSLPDVGADELGNTIFLDGFESGDTLAWSGSIQ